VHSLLCAFLKHQYLKNYKNDIRCKVADDAKYLIFTGDYCNVSGNEINTTYDISLKWNRKAFP
jgi:hypothetical protein